MSGADFLEVGFGIEEWEEMDSEIPLYLIEEDDEKEEKIIERNLLDCNGSVPSLSYDIDLEDKKEVRRNDEKEKCWSSRNGKKNLRGMIIIWTIVWIVMEKFSKSRSSFRSIIPYNSFVVEMMHYCI
ncbi:hypothetical protein ACS0TY_030777 [Phlomoides rotata]